jgi:2-polyprenyl-3-methyl-5-hydroxy-6-metoxy-1,4-benzoquinol methylase
MFSVAVCDSCGAGATLPHATTEDLSSFYPDAYSAHLLESGLLGSVQELGQRLILDRALARPPLAALTKLAPGRLLDVGCGRGDLGAALVRRGWRVAGIDPSEQACAIARARGVDTCVATLESAPFEEAAFDAVVMNHSLEHVVDPRDDLARCYRLLRPGGLLIVSVPNFGSWQLEVFGSKWYALDLPRHRTHFTLRALGRALSAQGFEIVSLRTTTSTAVLVASLQLALLGRQVLTHGPSAWTAYGFSALLAPLNRIVDRVLGGRALLDAVARRPARSGVG